MWSSSNMQISYGVPNEIGMMGFRDMFVLAPAATFQYGNQHYQEPILTFDHTNIPLLSASPCIQQPSNNIGLDECREIQFCQTQQPETSDYPIRNPTIFPSSGSGICSTTACITCRDCGNQAKKGCTFKRCRTCCKIRGFDCSTHVKSTWVPAATRRERQLLRSDVVGLGSAGSSQSQSINSSSKKPKVFASQSATASHGSTSNTTPPTSFESGSTHQADRRDVDGKLFAAAGDGNYDDKEPLPRQVRAPAVFKCVRVTTMDDGDNEYAYQATVIIGGHVFKGFLYDQGAADQVNRDGILNMSDLHLGGGERRDGDSSSMPAVNNMLHSSEVYGVSGDLLLGGLGGGASTTYLC